MIKLFRRNNLDNKLKAINVSIVLILVAILTAGCFGNENNDNDKIGIIVTLPPQVEMVEAIGGDKVKVTEMVPADQSPHSYEPKPSQMKEVVKAKAYFKVGSGVEFEINHLDTIKEQNQDMKIFDCSKGITILEMDEHHHEENSTRNGDHDHEGDDPHIWLSPSNTKFMVQNIFDGLLKIDSKNKGYYESNLEKYLDKLDNLINESHKKLDPYENNEFLVYHPAWGYFADEFNLIQLAVEEEGKAPGPSGIVALIEQAKEHNIKIIFVSPQFDKSSAETIAGEIGGKVVTVNPLAENYIENMEQVVDKMVEGFNL